MKFFPDRDDRVVDPRRISIGVETMFKPSPHLRARSTRHARVDHVAGFADTQFAHHEDDEDYSGFAPTEMFEQPPLPPLRLPAAPESVPQALREAAASAAVHVPAAAVGAAAGGQATGAGPRDEAVRSWATSRWVEAQEARAHEAAGRAHALLSAQRRGDASRAAPAGRLARLRRALQRVLPGDFYSVLPLFVCVSLTMALISAVLPLFDKP
jgi:hypothetical protein